MISARDEDLRNIALDEALRFHTVSSPTAPVDRVVETAEKFFRFLKGEDAPDPAR